MAEIGSGSCSSYPTTLDTDATKETNADIARKDVPNDLAACIVAVETELGALPKGSFASVAAKLAKMPRVCNIDVAAVGNVGAGEDDLVSEALTAALLASNGHAVRITAWGTMAANANVKTLKLYFGATALVTVSYGFNDATWRVDALVVRTGAATQDAHAEYQDDIPDAKQTVSTPAETLANAITVKCTGEGVADNDIVQEGLIIEYLPGP